jgi:hypothetical protein
MKTTDETENDSPKHDAVWWLEHVIGRLNNIMGSGWPPHELVELRTELLTARRDWSPAVLERAAVPELPDGWRVDDNGIAHGPDGFEVSLPDEQSVRVRWQGRHSSTLNGIPAAVLRALLERFTREQVRRGS